MLQGRSLVQQTQQLAQSSHATCVTACHQRMQARHGSKHNAAVLLFSQQTVNSWLQHSLRFFSTRLCAAAEKEVVPSSRSDTHTSSQQVQLPACQPHDIVRAVAADGSELFLEVLSAQNSEQSAHTSADIRSQQSHPQPPLLAYKGVVYTLSVGQSATSDFLQLEPQSWQLQQDHPLVKALPGWQQALQLQQSKQKLPHQPLRLQSATVVYSVAQLQAAVQQNPAVWCDGTGPLDPPLQGLQQQTLCAGEIECLLDRRRGVAMVQLSQSWDAASPQPVNNPLVLHALERALSNKHICIFMSKAPGDLGLTAILSAKADPFISWSRHLASFGAQAAVVADSPYYKLLIGRILGYKEDNIRYHIQSTSGRQHPSADVIAAVTKDLAKLSKKKPELPWKPDAATARGSGKQQQQQQQRKGARARR